MLKDEVTNPKFSVIANETFETQILNPVLSLTKDITDTNELFVRSIQLHEIFKKRSTFPVGIPSKVNLRLPINPIPIPPLPTMGNNIKKIGRHVQETIKFLIINKSISDSEIENLLSKPYSKDIFNINFAFLRKLNDDRFDEIGFSRYYSTPVEINGKQYYLCSQWIENSRHKFDEWVKRMEKTMVCYHLCT